MAILAIAFKTHCLERTADFYRALGLTLTREKHGSGPSHYSMEVGGLAVELYPKPFSGTFRFTGSMDVTVVVQVPSICDTLQMLWREGFTVDPHCGFGPDQRAKLHDPDGRAVVLWQP